MDTKIAARAIWNKYVFNLASILKQVNETKRVWKSSDVWQKIYCIDMEKVKAVDCPELAPLVNEYIAKSKQKIPTTYTSAAGDMLRDLNSTYPYGKQYRLVTPKEYRAIRQREFQDPQFGYAFIIDNYLYVPDSEIEKVTITGAFTNPKEVGLLNGDDPCKPLLDYNFYCPEYLVKTIHDMVLQDLAGVEQKIVKDEDPDLNENDRGSQPKKKYT
jgi:hypothetical protein